MAHLVLFSVSPEAKLVDTVDYLSKVVPALNPILELTENLSDLILYRISVFCCVLEFL